MSAEALLENCLPAVRLRSFRALSDIPVGASHFGGQLDLFDKVSVYLSPSSGIQRTPWPEDLDEEFRLDVALAVAEPTLTIPDWSGLRNFASSDQMCALEDALEISEPNHQLLGYPVTIQKNYSPSDCSLLLQMDSDPLIGTNVGDGGRLHVWLPYGWSPNVVDEMVEEIRGCIVALDCY